MNNDHRFSNSKNGFQISALMQELMVYAGHLDCYEKCNEVIGKSLSVEVSAAQVYRVTDYYGKAIGKSEGVLDRTMPAVKQEEILYVEADGSMLLTREEGWKEVKLGRIFKSGDCIDPNGKLSWIRHSQYLAHLGDSKTFTQQMDDLLASYGSLNNKMVFISDGALWIKNWIEDAFPNAVSILDYYHASEHLYQFVEIYFTDKTAGKIWAKEQEELLRESLVAVVIENIATIAGSNHKEAQKLIDYYQSNADRMNYKRYKKLGAGIVGSGAIESAHRTVIQKRMKLSGQRWSKAGAQNMLHLRTCSMNEQWTKVIQLAKMNFKQAA
jgi:hypothetical protein